MTIAACYVSAEGVVFGADSTTTIYIPGRGPGVPGTLHHYNFAQKVFQVGENSTLGMAMWGLGSLPHSSHRTLIAQFADLLLSHGAQSMEGVAKAWSQFFWNEYSTSLKELIDHARALQSRPTRTEEEQQELIRLLEHCSGGFCVGGYLMSDRMPSAFEIRYAPTLTEPAPVDPLPIGRPRFWGCPNLVHRLIYGLDEEVLSAILQSEKWKGTHEDLFALLMPHCLGQPFDLPIREAIDWVHASIYTTIKTMKFSHMPPVCGGPVEVAVITTDRKFRWVRHKGFDAAIGEGGLFDVYRDQR